MPETWSLPKNRALPEKLKERGGKVSVDLAPGPKVISHAFLNPERIYAPDGPRARSSVIAQVTVTQSPETVWDPNPMRQVVDPNIPARWGLVLMRYGFDPFSEDDSRIFSNKRVDLKAGTQRIEIPLQPLLWTSVFGKSMATKKPLWRDLWTGRAWLGLCFGGNFYAHGVAVSTGSARITIDQLKFKA